MHQILAIGMPGPLEWLIIAALGLLIFGKRLPEVGRSLGQGITEFKRGLRGVEEEIEQVEDQTSRPAFEPQRKVDKPAEQEKTPPESS